MIVAVSSDEFNKLKGKETLIPYKERSEIVANIKGVDLVIPEHNWQQKITAIQKYKVDIFTIGDDWQGKFDFLKDHCKVVYLPRTPNISSTQLKKHYKLFNKQET